MPVNTLTFEQCSAVLNDIMEQASGQQSLAAVNTSDFVSQAQTALLTGFDTICDAINQVLTRTIFSIRPYSAKFKGLEISEAAWGNHIRKLSIADKDFVDDDRYKWPVGYDATQTPPDGNGQSVDPFIINKPDILQTNFYGSSVYENSYTLTRDQLQQAFSGPEEFGRFVTLVTQNRADKLENARENMARMVLSNFIGGLIATEGAQIRGTNTAAIPLLTIYNTQTGLSLTAQTVYQPANFKAFVQWVYAYVAKLALMFTERSEAYQTIVNSKHIRRHTPYADQRIYLSAGSRFAFEMQALADVYHDDYLTMADVEPVSFWQNITDPDNIDVTANYTTASGTIATQAVDTATSDTPILGVIMDREAAGYAVTQMWSEPAINARGGYTTYWDHATLRCFNDFTEKGVVLLLA